MVIGEVSNPQAHELRAIAREHGTIGILRWITESKDFVGVVKEISSLAEELAAKTYLSRNANRVELAQHWKKAADILWEAALNMSMIPREEHVRPRNWALEQLEADHQSQEILEELGFKGDEK